MERGILLFFFFLSLSLFFSLSFFLSFLLSYSLPLFLSFLVSFFLSILLFYPLFLYNTLQIFSLSQTLHNSFLFSSSSSLTLYHSLLFLLTHALPSPSPLSLSSHSHLYFLSSWTLSLILIVLLLHSFFSFIFSSLKIYVIDSADRRRMEETGVELQQLLDEVRVYGTPVHSLYI